MVSFVSGLFFGLLAVAVVLWLRKRLGRTGGALSDEQIRAIEMEGSIEVEDPLDLDHIRDEETRFWEESWDEPEEF